MATLRPLRAQSSCIYRGIVTHARQTPKRHRLQYSVYMLFIELSDHHPELVMRDFWGWSSDDSVRSLRLPIPIIGRFSSRDYLSKEAVKAILKMQEVACVFVLCNGRCFGFIFNPICVYFAYDGAGNLIGGVSEVHNTPWGERVLYPHDFRAQASQSPTPELFTDRWRKGMHVSPFFTMNYDYILRLRPPGERLCVNLSMEDSQGNKPFTANLDLHAVPLTQWALLWTVLRFPFMTFVVVVAIYWHALLLWLKGVPFVSHPKKKKAV